MLKAETKLLLELIKKGKETKSLESLADQLEFLDGFGGEAIVELRPDFPASDNMWCWFARRIKDGEVSPDCFYNGGLLYRDGEWSLHS